MGLFDASQIVNLVGQLGGNHQQAGQMLSGLLGQGGQVDTEQHGEVLQKLGVDPQHLDRGGYQQHLEDQNQPGFQNYEQSQGQGGGYEQSQGQGGGYEQSQGQGGGYEQSQGQGGGYEQDQGQGGGYEQDQQ